jgi:hypothetical protein
MNGEELKQALLDESPVMLAQTDGTEIEYKCVSAIVYRKHGNRIVITAEIMDKNKHSVVICDPKKIRLKGGENGVR